MAVHTRTCRSIGKYKDIWQCYAYRLTENCEHCISQAILRNLVPPYRVAIPILSIA